MIFLTILLALPIPILRLQYDLLLPHIRRTSTFSRIIFSVLSMYHGIHLCLYRVLLALYTLSYWLARSLKLTLITSSCRT
ncbi:hypothetical protein BT96DRAFT_113932 [Gymnopus androsaceus JB14]|uniref:Uncharacterized protein n=1 Tax=Gymnopus androsaceus JB14 TaxID=1447944 RepID=A0A6A4HDJ0_9AGAR|nr:hypothetical protein BT96DRAFT_113932 [Gymnopus androsaceus JB14]